MIGFSFRQLEYFVAVAEHGSISAAARARHVSQPSVSVAIAQLEEALNERLFRRQVSRGLSDVSGHAIARTSPRYHWHGHRHESERRYSARLASRQPVAYLLSRLRPLLRTPAAIELSQAVSRCRGNAVRNGPGRRAPPPERR